MFLLKLDRFSIINDSVFVTKMRIKLCISKIEILIIKLRGKILNSKSQDLTIEK